MLGLLPVNYAELGGRSDSSMESIMSLIIDLRKRLRQEKNFALADEIRHRLAELKIELKDTPQGTTWASKDR